MKKETVKYENKLNEYSLTGFHAIDLDLFMLICSKVKDNKSELLSFPFVELKKAVGMTNKSDREFLKHLEQMSAKVKKINGTYKKDGQFFDFNLFSDFYGTLIEVTADNPETVEAYNVYGEVPKCTLLVSVNPRYAFLLNEMKNYTKFDLADFVKLESKYSKNLYRLLKQYRKTGKYRVGAERFRELMGCPKSYPNKEFMRGCVNVAIKELSRGYFEGLKVEPIRGNGRGKPILFYEFTFKKSKDVAGQFSYIDYDEKGKLIEAKPPKPRKTRFHNFPERNNNVDAIELQLLRAQGMTADQPDQGPEKPKKGE